MFRAVQTMRGWRLAGKSGMTETLAKVSENNHVLAFVDWAICFAGFLKEMIRFNFFSQQNLLSMPDIYGFLIADAS